MKRKRTTAYLALLMPVFLAWGTTAAVGTAQARVVGTHSQVQTVLRPTAAIPAAQSDLLIRGENEIILLGALEAQKTIEATFILESPGGTTAPLVCQVTDEAALPIRAQVRVQEGAAALTDGQLRLEAGARAVMTLTVTAPDAIPEERPALVRVEFGDLKGLFRIELEKDPTPTMGEGVWTDPEQGNEEEGTGTPAEDVEISVETEPEEEIDPEPVALTLAAPERYEAEQSLPLHLTVSGSPERVRVGLTDDGMLPAGSRYSLDGGESWYRLYGEGYLELTNVREARTILLRLHLPELTEETVLSLEVLAGSQAEWSWEGALDVLAVPRQERTDMVPILTGSDPQALEQLKAFLEPEELETPEEPEWNTDQWFSIPLPTGWEDSSEIRFHAVLLESDGEHGEVWAPGSLYGAIHADSGNLIVYLGEQPPRAGTYRLTLECIYEGTCFHREQMTFFINYSTRSDVQ